MKDPTDRIKAPSIGPKAPRALGRAEYRRLLCAANRGRHAERNVLMLRLMGESGLRDGTLVRLRVGDLFLDGNGAGWINLSRDKGNHQGRAIILPAVRVAVRKFLAHEGLTHRLDAYIFHRPREFHRHITSRQVHKIFAQAAHLAGLDTGPSVPTPHSLRHMFGYERKDEGNRLDDIQRLMNHAWLSTTLRYTMTPDAVLRVKVVRALRRAREVAE